MSFEQQPSTQRLITKNSQLLNITGCALSRLRFALAFRPLRAVFGSRLLPVRDPGRIQRAPNDVIPNAGQVLHATATDQNDGVFLQVMTNAWNVGRDFDPIREADARDFTQRGIRLLRRLREDADAHATFLRAVLQCRALGFADDFLAPGPNELTDGRHRFRFSKCKQHGPPPGGGSQYSVSGLEALGLGA